MWEYIKKLFGRGMVERPAARFKGDRIDKRVFNEVKSDIKRLRSFSKIYSVRDIADHHNIGKTTAYKIKNSRNWREYNADHS